MRKRGFETVKEERSFKPKMHPIWRGVGLVLIVTIPIIAFAAANVIIKTNLTAHFFPWPFDLAAKPGDLLYNGDQWLYFKIILTGVLMLVLYVFFTLITFLINSIFGAPRYDIYDVPPIKARVRKRAR